MAIAGIGEFYLAVIKPTIFGIVYVICAVILAILRNIGVKNSMDNFFWLELAASWHWR